MFKKGQAAMEFLMTYGWAILVVLIAIGALAYFGVLNPGRFLPSACTISNQIGCEEFKVTTNNLTVILRNGRGVNMVGDPAVAATPVRFGINTTIGSNTHNCVPTPTTPPTVINDGTSYLFNFGPGSCTPALTTFGTSGSKFKGDIVIIYGDSGSSLGQRQATGTINTKIE